MRSATIAFHSLKLDQRYIWIDKTHQTTFNMFLVVGEVFF